MSSSPTSEPTKRLYVGNLAVNVTQEDLAQLFGLQTTPYLRSSCWCELAVDEVTGKTKNFAFVTVPEHVASQLLNLNNIEFYGRQLVIEEAKCKDDDKDADKDQKKKKTSGPPNGTKKGGPRGNNPRFRGNRPQPRTSKFDAPVLEADQVFDMMDCGANLTNPKFHQNFSYVLHRAKASGVKRIVVTGLKLNGCKSARVLASNHPGVIYGAAAVHPHFVKDEWNDRAYEQIEELIRSPEVIAVGECGLDFKRDFSPRDLQKVAFEKQVELAVKYEKPLLVHDREAHDDVMEILNKFEGRLPPVVMHCFTGTTEHIKTYIDKGFYIGVTGFLCKEKHGKDLREAIRQKILPLDRIIIQSNAPYMVPNVPQREIDPVSSKLLDYCWSTNEPCSLSVVVRSVAKALDMEPRAVAETVHQNSMGVFKLSA